ncbi:hypothetical protein K438DRAFT_953636 [Mycena galopus ATCC 62051]|nr:hypothetical protein K438DRAFT_953636 [Mycena galopus ATCC 62051]
MSRYSTRATWPCSLRGAGPRRRTGTSRQCTPPAPTACGAAQTRIRSSGAPCAIPAQPHRDHHALRRRSPRKRPPRVGPHPRLQPHAHKDHHRPQRHPRVLHLPYPRPLPLPQEPSAKEVDLEKRKLARATQGMPVENGPGAPNPKQKWMARAAARWRDNVRLLARQRRAARRATAPSTSPNQSTNNLVPLSNTTSNTPIQVTATLQTTTQPTTLPRTLHALRILPRIRVIIYTLTLRIYSNPAASPRARRQSRPMSPSISRVSATPCWDVVSAPCEGP